jgi:hypothetical protein
MENKRVQRQLTFFVSKNLETNETISGLSTTKKVTKVFERNANEQQPNDGVAHGLEFGLTIRQRSFGPR